MLYTDNRWSYYILIMKRTDLENLANQLTLVTGGAGFIGSRLSSQLSEVTDLIILDDFSVGDPSAVPDDVRVIEVDVSNREAVLNSIPDVDVIFKQVSLASHNLSTLHTKAIPATQQEQ